MRGVGAQLPPQFSVLHFAASIVSSAQEPHHPRQPPPRRVLPIRKVQMDVVMPQMGESVAEGTITKWLKQVGDTVKRDEPLFEISTDKVDAEIPSPADGQLSEIIHGEGETVEVNVIVARIGAAGEAAADNGGAPAAAASGSAGAGVAAAAAPAGSAPASAAPAASTPAPATPAPAVATMAQPGAVTAPRAGETVDDLRRRRSSPLVRRIAAEHHVDLAAVSGTGISGRVTKADILAHINAGPAAASAPGPAAPPAFAPGEDARVETMSVMRQRIAEHMIMSRRTSAHVTSVFEVDVTRVMALRSQHKARFMKETGVNLSVTAFVARATVDALRAFPVVNASVDGTNVVYHAHVNLGIAVALDWGLIVPVIHSAEEKNLVGIARSIADLAGRARDKKLKPEEVQGGTFTITNPGVYGSLFGTPIINQPQVAILGVGGIVKRPMVVTAADGSDSIAVRSMCYLNISFDHRLLDGAVADQFVAHIKETLESARFPELA